MHRISLATREYFTSMTTLAPSRKSLLTVTVTGIAVAALALIVQYTLRVYSRHCSKPTHPQDPPQKPISHTPVSASLTPPHTPLQIPLSASPDDASTPPQGPIHRIEPNTSPSASCPRSQPRLDGDYSCKINTRSELPELRLLHGEAPDRNDSRIGCIISVGEPEAVDPSQSNNNPRVISIPFQNPDKCDFPCKRVSYAIKTAISDTHPDLLVLVCANDTSVSAAAIAAYLIRYHSLTPGDALVEITARKEEVNFEKFKNQLQRFHESLREQPDSSPSPSPLRQAAGI